MIQIIIVCIIVGVLASFCANGDLQHGILGYLIAVNVITFLIYAWDKIAAINGWWRIMEFTLHVLSLTGGWPAALFAQHFLNHKTRKLRFQIIFWCIGVIYLIGFYLVSSK